MCLSVVFGSLLNCEERPDTKVIGKNLRDVVSVNSSYYIRLRYTDA